MSRIRAKSVKSFEKPFFRKVSRSGLTSPVPAAIEASLVDRKTFKFGGDISQLKLTSTLFSIGPSSIPMIASMMDNVSSLSPELSALAAVAIALTGTIFLKPRYSEYSHDDSEKPPQNSVVFHNKYGEVVVKAYDRRDGDIFVIFMAGNVRISDTVKGFLKALVDKDKVIEDKKKIGPLKDQVQQHLRQKHFREAHTAAEKLVNDGLFDIADHKTQKLCVEAYRKSGNGHEALKLNTKMLNRGFARGEPDIEVIQSRVRIFISLGRFGEASNLNEKIIGPNGFDRNNKRSLEMQARALMLEWKTKEAMAVIDKIVGPNGIDPSYVSAIHTKIKIYVMERRYKEAFEWSDKLVGENGIAKNDEQSLDQRTELHLAAKEYDEALRWSDRLLELNPGYESALERRSKIHYRIGTKEELKKALDWSDLLFSPGKELGKKDTSAIIARARIYLKMLDRERAMEWIEKALAIDPENVSGAIMKAKAYRMFGERKAALRWLENFPIQSTPVLEMRAQLMLDEGLFEQFLPVNDSIIGRNGNNKDCVPSIRARVKFHRKQKDFIKAEEWSAKLVALRPDDVRDIEVHALILLYNKKSDEALRYINTIVGPKGMDRSRITSLKILAQIQMELEDYNEALETISRVIAMTDSSDGRIFLLLFKANILVAMKKNRMMEQEVFPALEDILEAGDFDEGQMDMIKSAAGRFLNNASVHINNIATSLRDRRVMHKNPKTSEQTFRERIMAIIGEITDDMIIQEANKRNTRRALQEEDPDDWNYYRELEDD